MSNQRFLVDNEGKTVSNVPKLKDVKPFGSTILVEMLSAEEALGTKFYVGKQQTAGAPQAYVVAFGSKLNESEIGLKVGDRVMLQGTYVPVPNFNKNHRDRGIVELHNIKAVLEEEVVSSEEG